jgi:hypothetical protein
MFNPIEELKNLVQEIEGKIPTKIEDLLIEKKEFYEKNGIIKNMHVGETNWTKVKASEWLLSMFIGLVEKGIEDERYYNGFGTWLNHVYHFIINDKANLPEE